MSVRRRRTSSVAVAAAVAVLAMAGCTGGSTTDGRNFTEGDGSITILQADQRKPPTGPLRGTTIDGEEIDLANFRGSPVVLNVWGSWCPPCRAEAPALQAASVALAPKGVKFLGINIREDGNRDRAAAFERTYGITYPSLFDSTDYLLALRGVIAANAVPSTIVIDAQGRVAARILGPATKTTLVDLVEDVVAGTVSR